MEGNVKIDMESGELFSVSNTKDEKLDEMRKDWTADSPICAMPQKISIFSRDFEYPTRNEIISEIGRLKNAKSLKSESSWLDLVKAIEETAMTKMRLRESVNNILYHHKFSTFQFSELLDYDETTPLFLIRNLHDSPDNVGKTFVRIKYKGWRGMWLDRRQASRIGIPESLITGEMTVESKKTQEDKRESDFVSDCAINGLRNSMIFVEKFNLRHKTHFTSFRELYEWYKELPSDYIRDNRLDEPLFPENKDVKF